MKLLTEDIKPFDILVESNDAGEKQMFIEGKFLSAERKNANGRVYPKAVMEKAVNRFEREFMNTGTAMGELEHPPRPNVKLEEAAIVIESLKWDTNGIDIMGRAKVLNTPKGQILKGLLEGGIKLGVSSRGLGSLKKLRNGLMEVQSDFRLGAIDVVSTPSGDGCYVDAIMESVDWIEENGEWIQKEPVNEAAVLESLKEWSKTKEWA